MVIRINEYITTKQWGKTKFKVVKKNTGYKKDCFDTDIGERYFLNNRFKSWTKVKKNEK